MSIYRHLVEFYIVIKKCAVFILDRVMLSVMKIGRFIKKYATPILRLVGLAVIAIALMYKPPDLDAPIESSVNKSEQMEQNGLLIDAHVSKLNKVNSSSSDKQPAPLYFVWLRASIWTSIIITGLVYILVLLYGILTPPHNATKFGAGIAVLSLALLIWLAYQADINPLNKDQISCRFHGIALGLVGVSFLIAVSDYFLLKNIDSSYASEVKGIILLDWAVFFAVLITYLYARHNVANHKIEEENAMWFKAGAMAAEVAIANFLFDPKLILRQFMTARKLECKNCGASGSEIVCKKCNTAVL